MNSRPAAFCLLIADLPAPMPQQWVGHGHGFLSCEIQSADGRFGFPDASTVCKSWIPVLRNSVG